MSHLCLIILILLKNSPNLLNAAVNFAVTTDSNGADFFFVGSPWVVCVHIPFQEGMKTEGGIRWGGI